MRKLHKHHLTLSKETLRLLDERDFAQVAGGVTVAGCSNGTSSCCTDTCGHICTRFNC
jgi:hypothetical protein